MIMDLYLQELTGAAVLVVTGRVTVEEAPPLAERLRAELNAHRHRLVLDLSKVEFMGSAGLGALISAIKNARAEGGDLVLAAPSSVVHTLLHVSGLLDFVRHAESAALGADLLPA
jgi:anti-sigma B factor antagonist